ncbi:hypothetical protein HJFPF1_08325 [Paramyrothecium foliicola]|nr:hypothetical protein HJFPF1_08325 [Paramyrothecium foliicola]
MQSWIPPQGMNSSQEKKLRKRPRGASDEEKWVDIYKILFPDEDSDLVPSPYYETAATSGKDEILDYERVQRRELLRVVRQRLEEEASRIARPMEDDLRAHFMDIIRTAQVEVYKSYRSSANQDQQIRGDLQLGLGSSTLTPQATQPSTLPDHIFEGQGKAAQTDEAHSVSSFANPSQNMPGFTQEFFSSMDISVLDMGYFEDAQITTFNLIDPSTMAIATSNDPPIRF